MLWYAIKRILIIPVMLLVIGLFIFLLLSLNKTDPVLQMLPSEYTIEDYYELQARLGLDKPVVIQYFNWLRNALKGDFGISYKTRGPAINEVAKRVPVSLEFSIITTLAVFSLGVPLGVFCAVKQYTVFDRGINMTAKSLGSVPGFLLGVLLILVFAQKLKWVPTFGFSTPKHWILPVLTQLLPFTANTIRQTRSVMLDCTRQDYVRTARSKGAKESRVIFRDTLRNALLPIIASTGNHFAVFIGGAVVVENVFAIPGVGSKVVESINAGDMPVVMLCAMVISIMFTGMALVIDLCYALVDPRIKSTFLKAKKSGILTAVKAVA
jgi:peptide/nickel transport system permease protein